MIDRAALLLALLLIPASAQADVAWAGGFETGDLSEYNFLLNPTIDNVDYTTVVQDIVADGTYAARIELHDDARWGNGLRRVEVQHLPAAARTAEGATGYFAWSFYLPEELPSDPSQQIAYWESRNSFRQMMAFTLRGSDLSFVTRQPNNVVHWDGAGVATPGEWHRVAMKIVWSKDPAIGTVSVWFDGTEVVSDVSAKTLNDDNEHFVQMGLLRGDMDFADVPVIYLDDAIEADTLDEVRPDLPTPMMDPRPTDMGQPDGGNGADDIGTLPADMAGEDATGGEPDGGSMDADGDAGSPGGGIDPEDKGCCTQVATPAPAPPQLLWLSIGLLWVRRARSRLPE